MQDQTFWDNIEEVNKFSKELSNLKREIEAWKTIENDLQTYSEMWENAYHENDQNMLNEIEFEIEKIFNTFNKLEIRSIMSEKEDFASAYLQINAGAGGTESCDWTSMLLRMYLRWAERNNCSIEIIDQLNGEEAGIKNVTILIKGEYAYGYLKSEIGVHRLVRISPFDSNARRHTSFASVFVYPEIDEEINIEIDSKDIRVDRFRSSGAGGQHVNTTDSAIRITHLVTNIVVTCQNERSQHKNLANAMKVLKSRLYNYYKTLKEEEKAGKIEKKDIAWGNQIRSYVFQPYTLVKDLRTNYETGNVNAIMDGELDDFMDAYLKWNLSQRAKNH